MMSINEEDIRHQKEKMRQDARWKRRRHHNIVCPEDEGNKILHRLRATALIKPTDRIGGYYPTGAEVDSLPLLRAYAQKDNKIGLPRIKGMDLFFCEWDPETSPEQHQGKEYLLFHPTVLIVPLLAFDDCGRRLGQGGGFYDRAIERLKKTNPSFMAIGISYECQKITAIACEPHDQKLQAVITPEFTYIFDKNGE